MREELVRTQQADVVGVVSRRCLVGDLAKGSQMHTVHYRPGRLGEAVNCDAAVREG